jgi:hypothetical protein
MYDTSVLGDLLRIVVGMTYQNSEAAHYIAKETDLLKTITFIIKTRKGNYRNQTKSFRVIQHLTFGFRFLI